jgi:hypothetical protein
MKKIILSAMVLLMLLVSIGGCFVPWYEDGRDRRDGGYHRDGGYDRGPGHDRDRGPGGPGGPGGYDRDEGRQ